MYVIDLGLDELFAHYSSRNAKTCLSFASVLISLYTDLLELLGSAEKIKNIMKAPITHLLI